MLSEIVVAIRLRSRTDVSGVVCLEGALGGTAGAWVPRCTTLAQPCVDTLDIGDDISVFVVLLSLAVEQVDGQD
jgi:hypothetical protein